MLSLWAAGLASKRESGRTKASRGLGHVLLMSRVSPNMYPDSRVGEIRLHWLMARATKPICKGCGYKWAKNWQSFLYAIHHNILRLINILTFSQITQNIQNTFIPSFCPKLCYYCSILSPILLSESPTNQTWFIMIYTVNVLWDLPIHLTLSWFTIILLLPFPTILLEEYTLNFLHWVNSVQSLSCV